MSHKARPECGVCTLSRPRLLVCKKCNYGACKKCYATYIEGKDTMPSCMGCHVPFEQEELKLHLGKVKGHKLLSVKRKHSVVDTDKDYIIPTMEYVVPMYKRMRRTCQQLKKVKTALGVARQELEQLNREVDEDEESDEEEVGELRSPLPP